PESQSSTLNPELHTHFATLAKTHGPIFAIKLGNRLAIVIGGVDMAKEVLRVQDDNFANRIIPAAAKTMEYIKSNIVSSPNGPTLRLLRKICVREMLGKASLDRMAGEAVDVGAQMFLMVMNVITSMLWGGVVEGEEKRKEVRKEFREVVGDITEMLGKPNLSDFFPRLERFDVQGIQRKMKEKLVRLDGIFERIIEERKKNGGDGCEDKDFLGFMLRMEKDGGADDNSKSGTTTPFTINHVKALLMDMVFGGTETTSNTVEWAMAELIQKPEMMKKAQQELEQVVGKDNMVEESHLPKLTYLGSVIKEVLRLHPALPLLVPHCPSSTCTINGYTIPQGSQVFVNVWAIHRDPAIWENPLEFKPERFLGIDGSKWDFTGNDFRYFPFGSGRRICAGIPMAERIVGYALASLLHSFDWNLPEGTKLDLSERFGIVLKKATPLVAVPTPKLSREVLAS
ncbi:Cytochrome P450 E-class group I protein, partial [Dioscorea alata]